MSQSASTPDSATCSDGLDLGSAQVPRHYFPSLACRESHRHSSDEASSGVSSRLQHVHFQSESFHNSHELDKEWIYSHDTGFTAFSFVSGIQSTRSSPSVNLHHRAGSSFALQRPDFIDFSTEESNFLSACPIEKFQQLNRASDYDSNQGKLGAVMDDIRKLAGFFRTSSSNSEILDVFYPHSSARSVSNSTTSSLGSYHPFEESPIDHSEDIFQSIDSGLLKSQYLNETSSRYPYLGFNKAQRQVRVESEHGLLPETYTKNTTKWNRNHRAQRMYQERRRMRQLVFLAAAFIIGALLLCGIFFIHLERQSAQVNISYEAVGLPSFIDSPDRDSLIIYRIIGNDLPPRHSPTQTLTNLQFMLEHEGDFEERVGVPNADPMVDTGRVMPSSKWRVKKFFVLNRIVNETQLELVRNMLRAHSVKHEQILINAFVTETYRDQPLSSPPYLGKKNGLYPSWGTERESVTSAINQGQAEDLASFNTSSNHERWKALEFTYHFKNLYAMNNNGGRNFALEHGRLIPEARWILPLDGNSFFTPAALHSLVLSLRKSESEPSPPSHVVIPMSRLTNNDQAIVQNTPIDLNEFGHDGDRLREIFGPKTTDEPQVGFRFTSKEIYSAEMRYGHRSKLEFLWRLGAIDRNRNLDQTTKDWETLEKSIITAQSYGSIKPTLRDPASGRLQIAESSHSKMYEWPDTPDFVRAGWVFRLFSGDQSQERHGAIATSRRRMSRTKGIISFLEGVDESLARGSSSCRTNHSSDHCGFSDRRLWSLDGAALEKMKLQRINKDAQTIQLVDHLVKLSETYVNEATSIPSKHQKISEKSVDLSKVSTKIFLLAVTAYLTDNESYADTAANLLNMIFLQSRYFLSTPDAFQVTINPQLRYLSLQADYDGFGYAFPIPRHKESLPSWMKETDMKYLPFNPYTFDPTLLLDGIRLLRNDWKAADDVPQSQWLRQSLEKKIPKLRLKELFTLQMSHLLLNDSIVQEHFTQGSDEMMGLRYASKLSALASFTDDVQLLNRILNRTPIELALLPKSKVIDSHSLSNMLVSVPNSTPDFIHLCQLFRAGFYNVKILTSKTLLDDGFAMQLAEQPTLNLIS